jgi:hypothetical protein
MEGAVLLYRPGIISSSNPEIFRFRQSRKDRMIERLLEATQPAGRSARIARTLPAIRAARFAH